MLHDLANLFEEIEIIWCDNPGKEIYKHVNYEKLISLFPNLKEIHLIGLNSDKFEFDRTMRHVFRSFKIYFLLKQGLFTHQSLSDKSLKELKEKIQNISNLNEIYLPIIIMYHDIGRFIDRKLHAYQSSSMISKEALLDCFKLTSMEKLLLRKLIEYHLLLATIYTGESTFFGSLSLINDKEFIELISFPDRNYAELFVDLLETFTYLDILGYPYSRIFDHYLNYYKEISLKLKNLLKLWPDHHKINYLAKEYSLQWTDWRLAGALRIFQFVKTEPHLTEEFYFNVLKESIRPECEKKNQILNWNLIKNKYLSNIYKFQTKYALAFLMLLAFGELKRLGLKQNQVISPKLLLFWIFLSSEVQKRGLSEKEVIWNIYFEKLPFWSDMTKSFIEKLEINELKAIIKNATIKFDKYRGEYNLILDFGKLL